MNSQMLKNHRFAVIMNLHVEIQINVFQDLIIAIHFRVSLDVLFSLNKKSVYAFWMGLINFKSFFKNRLCR